MNKVPLLVAVSNQKGGVGKSTLTVSLASYLHYVMEKNVLVVDCDYPQHSLSNLRDRDKKQVMASERLQKMMADLYDRTGRKAYPIINSLSDKVRLTIDSYLKDNAKYPCDIIFVDLPGTLNTMGVMRTILSMDYVLMPIIPDRIVMHSSLASATATLDFIKNHPAGPLKDVLLVWNRIDRRVSPRLFNLFDELINHLGLTRLKTTIPETHRFDKELSPGDPFFRSTLFPPSPSLLKDSGIDLLAEELCCKFKI